MNRAAARIAFPLLAYGTPARFLGRAFPHGLGPDVTRARGVQEARTAFHLY